MMGKDKIHRMSTLMNYTKEELAEHCIALEKNYYELKESFDVQYENCMKLIDTLNMINERYKNSKNK